MMTWSLHSLQIRSRIKFYLFRLLPLGVATADVASPFDSIIYILLRHFRHCHALSRRIHRPLFRPSPFPISWQLRRQHLLLIYPSSFTRMYLYVQTASILPLVFSLQPVPAALSLSTKIITSSTLPRLSPPPVQFSLVLPSPTRTTLLVHSRSPLRLIAISLCRCAVSHSISLQSPTPHLPIAFCDST